MDKPGGTGLWVYWVALVLALTILGFGVYFVIDQRQFSVLAAGAASVVAVLVTWPLAMGIAQSRAHSAKLAQDLLSPINDRFEQFSVMLNEISEQQLLSDRAKAVAFRVKDREALRRAIQEELGKGDFEAAWSLANDMELHFGNKMEADQLRHQISEKRNELARKQVMEAVTVIDKHTRAEQWQQAHREADRLIALYPHSDQVRNLPNEIETRKNEHKKRLLESFHDAVNRKDTDGGVELLKKLDSYLAPSEAEQLQESARAIFKQRLENLRTQFSVAVQDHNWNETVRVGDIIIREYPNTQMAKEVREAMENLRSRAHLPEPAPV